MSIIPNHSQPTVREAQIRDEEADRTAVRELLADYALLILLVVGLVAGGLWLVLR